MFLEKSFFEDCKFKAKRIKGKASSIPDDLFSIKNLNFEVIGNIYDGITKESRYCQKVDDVISKEIFKKLILKGANSYEMFLL